METITNNQPSLLKLSVSKSKTFSDCKKKYHFSYILHLPRKEFEYHTMGKLCHRVLELFHLELMESPISPPNQVMSRAFRASCAEYQDKMTSEMQIECKEIATKYLKYYVLTPTPTVIGVEKPFSIDLDNKVLLNGVIDKVQIDVDGIYHVLDYKTTKNKKYLNDNFQLLSYAFILHQEDPSIETVRGSYVCLRHDMDYITTEFGLSEILAIKDKYLEYARNINTEEEFEANPSFMCKFCEFLEACPEGKQQVSPHISHGRQTW